MKQQQQQYTYRCYFNLLETRRFCSNCKPTELTFKCSDDCNTCRFTVIDSSRERPPVMHWQYKVDRCDLCKKYLRYTYTTESLVITEYEIIRLHRVITLGAHKPFLVGNPRKLFCHSTLDPDNF